MDPYVQRHLREVCRTLGEDQAHPGRRRLLAVLDRYAEAGVFPRPSRVNPRGRRVIPKRIFVGPGTRHPLFKDDRGTFCAVGHMIAVTDPVLAESLSKNAADAYIPEIEDPRLEAWAMEWGFTWDELAWIQPSYCDTLEVCDAEKYAEWLAGYEVYDTCVGQDPGLMGFAVGCRLCEGPYRVYQAVANPEDEPLTVTLNVVNDALEVLQTQADVVLPANSNTLVVFEFETKDALQDSIVELVALGDCDTSDHYYNAFEPSGSAALAEPLACNPELCCAADFGFVPCEQEPEGSEDATGTEGTEPDGTEASTEGTELGSEVPGAVRKGGCGCDSAGGGWGWASWLALVLRRRAVSASASESASAWRQRPRVRAPREPKGRLEGQDGSRNHETRPRT